MQDENIIEQALSELKNEADYVGYIYKITNLITNHFYIGKTHYPVDRRIYHHLYSSKNYNDTTSVIHNAIRKYGWDNFKVETLQTCYSEDELNQAEKNWIKKLDARNPDVGYNLAAGGEGGIGGPMFAGHHHSEETKHQMSISRRGENNSNYNHHRIMPDDEKMKHANPGSRNGMFGKHHSNTSKELSRQKHINKKAYSNIQLDQVKMLTPEEGEKLMNEDPNWIEANIHARMYKKDN